MIKLNDAVNIKHITSSASVSQIGVGKVVKITATQIHVLNRHGNVCKYRVSDNKAVGSDDFCYYYIEAYEVRQLELEQTVNEPEVIENSLSDLLVLANVAKKATKHEVSELCSRLSRLEPFNALNQQAVDRAYTRAISFLRIS